MNYYPKCCKQSTGEEFMCELCGEHEVWEAHSTALDNEDD